MQFRTSHYAGEKLASETGKNKKVEKLKLGPVCYYIEFLSLASARRAHTNGTKMRIKILGILFAKKKKETEDSRPRL